MGTVWLLCHPVCRTQRGAPPVKKCVGDNLLNNVDSDWRMLCGYTSWIPVGIASSENVSTKKVLFYCLLA